jgi:hypothetical protein
MAGIHFLPIKTDGYFSGYYLGVNNIAVILALNYYYLRLLLRLVNDRIVEIHFLPIKTDGLLCNNSS